MRFDRTLGQLTVGHTNQARECVRLTALTVRFLSCGDQFVVPLMPKSDPEILRTWQPL
jgi:hypothetical protein